MSSSLGIDTASNRLHWVSSSKIDSQFYGWVTCKDSNVDIRRAKLYHYALGLFTALPDDFEIFCEEPLALQNGKTTRLLGLSAGAIWAAYVQSGTDAIWHWVDQSTWKKQVLGRGRRPADFQFAKKADAEKEWIRSVVFGMLAATTGSDPVMLEDFLAQTDLCDAWAICKYGQKVQVERRINE